MSARKLEQRGAEHHRILSLRVTGGFFADAELHFADGLNCFIGGRGAGKTTALEFLRFGLGLMPDLKTNPSRHRAIEALVKANLGNGRLSIELQTKAGMHYTAHRTVGDSVQVMNESGTAVPVSLERDLIFSADVFSQNEIEEIASSPPAQLALLDRFQEEETSAIARDLEGCRRQLEQSGGDLYRIDQKIDDLRSKASEVAALEERLRGLAEVGGGDDAKVNAAHGAKSLRLREAQLPDLLAASVRKAQHEFAASAETFRATVEAQLEPALFDGANQDVFRPLRDDVRSFERTLADAGTSLDAAGGALELRLTAHAALLATLHATQDAEYTAMVASSEEQGGRAAQRVALQGALATALAAAKEQLAKEKQRDALLVARNTILKRMSELRDDRFALRKRVAERLSEQFQSIRVTVAQATELDQYRALIAEALKGVGIKQGPAAEKISQAFLPTELALVVAQNDYTVLGARAGFDAERAKRIIELLKTGGAAYQIEAVDLDDRPCIELLDGDTYKESSHLSTGQRCTTILPILLVQSERPLLIDQPEDNLDNAFVYDTIVKALTAVKGGRQVIFVTHNPNIPVLGEAERVFVFVSDGQKARVYQAGTVDECKEQIERILEGGREAFLRRKKRYGH